MCAISSLKSSRSLSHLLMSSGGTILACDGQKDGQTDTGLQRILRWQSVARVKKCKNLKSSSYTNDKSVMKSAAEKASSWIMEMEKILRGQMWCNGSSAGMDVIFSVRGAVSSPHYRPDDVTSDDESTQRYMTHTSC